jgi:hypothetical protein
VIKSVDRARSNECFQRKRGFLGRSESSEDVRPGEDQPR